MTSLQGHLLIAGTSLVDPNFAKTVILMVQHDDTQALGVVLNRPVNRSIKTAWEKVSDVPCNCDAEVHFGGPCEGPLMVVHTHEDMAQLEVLPGVFFSTEEKDVEWLVEHNSEPIRFFVGYAGWSAGQLEGELASGSWLTMPATAQHIFEPDDDPWTTVMKALNRATGSPHLNPKFIPKDPSMN